MSSSRTDLPVVAERQAPSANGSSDLRLTVAQALVRFLQVQHSRRDGEEQRLIPAMFGIFGHGNVAGLGQALVEYGAELPYYQPFNEQSMVHTAVGFAKATNRRVDARLHIVDRPGRDEHAHRRGPRDDQPAAGAAASFRLLRDPPPGPGAAAARAPGLLRRERQRLLPARQPLLRPHLAPRAAPRLAARGDARAHRPGRDRRGHDRAAAGRPGRGLRLPGAPVRAQGLGARAAAAGRRAGGRARRAAAPARAPVPDRGRRRSLLGGLGGAGRVRRGVRHPGRRDLGGQGLVPRRRGRCSSAASA